MALSFLPSMLSNLRRTVVKAVGLRLADAESPSTTTYVDLIMGTGAPSGGYGRDSGATMLYFREDASTVATALYVTVNGGTAWTAINPSSVTSGALEPSTLTAQAIGASTAAAGTTYADAGALPAGTSVVYPTTGADDTKGVIVHTSDKVTGRILHIGNGVSNKILKVYGPSGATINGASANTAFSSASGKGVVMICLSSGSNTWLAW